MENQLSHLYSEETKDKLIIFKIYNNPDLLEDFKTNVKIGKHLNYLFEYCDDELKVSLVYTKSLFFIRFKHILYNTINLNSAVHVILYKRYESFNEST